MEASNNNLPRKMLKFHDGKLTARESYLFFIESNTTEEELVQKLVNLGSSKYRYSEISYDKAGENAFAVTVKFKERLN